MADDLSRDLVIIEARSRATEYLRSVESNVVQDRITMEAVNRALDYARRYITVPEPPRKRRRTLAEWFFDTDI